ncbi:excisionase family DNA-binding protein [Mycobacterium sp.]|uniref:excisionase family DNA-binding protein n=1 Tax=Mycobacterium sp. TaxID=1785 RepID=UPI003F996928
MVRRHYITIGKAAEYLQISDRRVRRLIADGELTGYRMGRSRPSTSRRERGNGDHE